MRIPRPIVETVLLDHVPDCPDANKLVRKHGKVCLRRMDTIERRKDGKLRVTKTWVRQGRKPFSTDIYEWANSPEA